MTKNLYTYALGRRKSATARVRITSGKGIVLVNEKPLEEYFSNSSSLIDEVIKPFVLLEKTKQYDVSAKVKGGGSNGQADAIKLGIAKGLVILNEEYKSTLKKADLLGRDAREKERKKFGLKSARKKRQFTKR